MKDIIENYSSVSTLTENLSVIKKLKVYSEELTKQLESGVEEYTYIELDDTLEKIDHLESIGLSNSKNCQDLVNKAKKIKDHIVKCKKQEIVLEDFTTLKDNLPEHEIYLVSQENFSKLLGEDFTIIPLSECKDEFKEDEIEFLSELHSFNPYEELVSYSQLSCYDINGEGDSIGIVFLKSLFTEVGNSKHTEHSLNQFAVLDFGNMYPYDEKGNTLVDLIDNPSDYLTLLKNIDKDAIFQIIQKKSLLDISRREVYLDYDCMNSPLIATGNIKVLFNFLNGYIVVLKILENI